MAESVKRQFAAVLSGEPVNGALLGTLNDRPQKNFTRNTIKRGDAAECLF
jgi:hypothetical protein